jgi:hypothetical protein
MRPPLAADRPGPFPQSAHRRPINRESCNGAPHRPAIARGRGKGLGARSDAYVTPQSAPASPAVRVSATLRVSAPNTARGCQGSQGGAVTSRGQCPEESAAGHVRLQPCSAGDSTRYHDSIERSRTHGQEKEEGGAMDAPSRACSTRQAQGGSLPTPSPPASDATPVSC